MVRARVLGEEDVEELYSNRTRALTEYSNLEMTFSKLNQIRYGNADIMKPSYGGQPQPFLPPSHFSTPIYLRKALS